MNTGMLGMNGNVPGARLTPRQRAVHALLRRGMTNKQIARELGIAAVTVKVHVGSLLIRLDAANRLQAALKDAA